MAGSCGHHDLNQNSWECGVSEGVNLRMSLQEESSRVSRKQGSVGEGRQGCQDLSSLVSCLQCCVPCFASQAIF